MKKTIIITIIITKKIKTVSFTSPPTGKNSWSTESSKVNLYQYFIVFYICLNNECLGFHWFTLKLIRIKHLLSE